LSWLKRELNRPYFESRMKWYSGLPRAFAPIEAQILGGGPVSVARLTQEGAFVFSPQGEAPNSPEVGIEFNFAGRKVRMKGGVVRQFDHPGSGWGAGIRFAPLRPDQKKDFGDFLNAVWSHGHAD